MTQHAIDILAIQPLDDLIRDSGDTMRKAAARVGKVPDFDKAEVITDEQGRTCYSIPLVPKDEHARRQTD